jgi:hypothetical protein
MSTHPGVDPVGVVCVQRTEILGARAAFPFVSMMYLLALVVRGDPAREDDALGEGMSWR